MDMFYQINEEMNKLNVVWENVLARDFDYDDDLWEKICDIRLKLYMVRLDLAKLGIKED